MTSAFIRLCVFLLVAAFGSRPVSVAHVEGTPAPFTAELRIQRSGELDGEARQPAVPTVGAFVRGGSVTRAASSSGDRSANGGSAEVIAWAQRVASLRLRRESFPRRTPCSACGDGTPYDATAPPARV